jgi:hypothetical protein
VVTQFEFRLHEVGPSIRFAMLFYGQEQAAAMFRLGREVLAELPRQFTMLMAATNAPAAPFVPEQFHNQRGYAILLADVSPEEQGAEAHEQVVARIRQQLPPLFDSVGPMPFVDLQKLSDETMAWGQYSYEKSANFSELSDDVIEILVAQAPLRSSPLSMFLIVRLDGAYSDVADGDTAFGGSRAPQFGVFISGVSLEQQEMVTDREWVRSCWQALQPHAIGIGSYVNAMSEFEDDRVRAAYGDKYVRLARIKAEYDPQNVFHRNLNILPA